MAGEFSTAGITFRWIKAGAETTPPKASDSNVYKQLPGIKSSPEFNPEPTTLDVTPLDEKEYHRYIPALKDLGGAMGYTANLTKDFKDSWDEMVTAAGGDGEVWIETVIPNFESFYYRGRPTTLGMPAFEVDSVAEINAYMTPNYVHGWGDASDKTI